LTLQAVILAAGEGSRMHPLTATRPKVMLPLAGKPILEHLLLELKRAGVREVVLVVGYQAEAVRQYFGSGEAWDLNITYRTQAERRGTADAVRQCRSLVSERFLVLNGDIIIQHEDISRLLVQPGTALCAREVEHTEGLGILEVEGNQIVRLHEKTDNPPGKLANTGVYLFTDAVFGAIARVPLSPRGEYELPAAVQLLIDEGLPVSCQMLSSWLDVSHPWDLLRVNESLLGSLTPRNEGVIEEGVHIRGACVVGAGTRLRSGTYIVGPVLIGANCEIGPHCYLRPATAIGDRCHIGAGVEIKNSIIMRGSKIPHLSYMGDSVIGEGCNLGAGTNVANLRFDEAEVAVDGRSTGRRKMGVVMGDGVKTGVNASILPGTVIGAGAWIGPSALAKGTIEAGARVLRRWGADLLPEY
jgi:UDP-N-acetylglucosamine diphosphorylase/glucosamine-1-phosphate N-acetyltransferase